MNQSELLATILALVGIGALAAWHLAGLKLLQRFKPTGGHRQYFTVLLIFWGLLLLHFSEIVWCALMLWGSLALSGGSDVVDGYGDTPGGLLYLAGVTFTTLGFSGQVVRGPLRLVLMLQSLGGFMLLTWSATFVYSLWDERFR